MNNKSELDATIRNKLQTAVTVLESLANDKRVPKNLIEAGKKDLVKVLEMLEDL